jgi:hypothetical protein
MSSALDKRWFEAVARLESCVLCGEYGVQVAHRNESRGLSQKSESHNTAALCPDCHNQIDNGSELNQMERRALMNLAIVRTHDKLVKSGQLVLGGKK